MNYVEALEKVFLFKELSKVELKKLASVAREYTLPPGASLFREGEPADEFFVIVIGTAKVMKVDASGDDEEVAVLATGSYFGEVEFVATEQTRAATVAAQDKLVVLGFKHAEVLKLIEKDDKLGLHLYKAIARGLASRLNATTRDAVNFKGKVLHHV